MSPVIGRVLYRLAEPGEVLAPGGKALTLVDLGDGVACLEFHSKMNSLGDDIVQMLGSALEETSRGFEALVIANQGENFSVGANLMLVLLAVQEGEWEELGLAIHRFQQVNMALKYAAKPVVVAPFARTLASRAVPETPVAIQSFPAARLTVLGLAATEARRRLARLLDLP